MGRARDVKAHGYLLDRGACRCGVVEAVMGGGKCHAWVWILRDGVHAVFLKRAEAVGARSRGGVNTYGQLGLAFFRG